MKTIQIFTILVVGTCILMYALVDVSALFLLPIFWLFWLLDGLGIKALVGGESFGTFPTYFGFAMIFLGFVLSLIVLYFFARYISKILKKEK